MPEPPKRPEKTAVPCRSYCCCWFWFCVDVLAAGALTAIAGIGINLQTPDLPDAIGLSELCSAVPEIDVLRDAILRGIERRIAVWERDGFERVRFDWKARSITIGNNVRVTGIDPEVIGLAQGIGPDGELIVRVEDAVVPIYTGTVRAIDGSYC